ncbi:D-alanine--D-alanine ligase [Agromyces sp. NPDC056965]|uniref:D-alanine--D-alanine ligase family protein n=1 Tax=Agromyces sp. NPDC056965 TaxID=3345983 RepID=UPI0036379AC9
MTQNNSTRIAVIGGGVSDEHDVSLASAAAVGRAIVELGFDVVPLTIGNDGAWRDEDGGILPAHGAVELLADCDIAFPALHGVNGEDGAIAGFLELSGVPYVGAPVRAGALGMDKWVTKLIAGSLGIATAKAIVARPGAATVAAPMDLKPPFVIKPATGGSSNGVFVVPDRDDVAATVSRARAFGDPVLVEEYVLGREVDVAVFRDRDGELRLGSTLGIGVAPGGVFDRTQKYDGSAVFTVPAPISDRDEVSIRHAARLLYETLGCSGVARFDFFATAAGVVLNEVNTAPGMTEQSQVPLMYAATGLDYVGLIAALLESAERSPFRNSIPE